jgi:hypothetical protein
MSSRAVRFAIAIVRGWTRLYTWRLPAAAREDRRAEIESDLWEFQQDSHSYHGLNPAVHTLIRLLLGIPDDLQWRTAHAAPTGRTLRIAAALAAAVLLLAALEILDLMRPRRLPLPPVDPRPNVSLTPSALQPSSKPNR